MAKQETKIQPLTIETFSYELSLHEKTLVSFLGTRYNDFIAKTVLAVTNEPNLLKCTPKSLLGSILYFAELNLPFNTHEGYGHISIDTLGTVHEATPVIGYKGLVEIAYRNPKIKSIKIQSVYEKDEFDYEYGTNEFLKHKPISIGNRGNLTAVYAIAQIEGISPMFVVVHKPELDKIQKMSNSASSKYSKNDVFNIMQAKVPLKLLFKTLPKQGNEPLTKALEMDNKFDYDKKTRIMATEKGYEIVDNQEKPSALRESDIEPLVIKETVALLSKKAEAKK